MGIKSRTIRAISSAGAVAGEYADVVNIRSEIYKKKADIIRTPMVQEIITCTFSRGLPRKIWANGQGLFASMFDAQSRTYHPNGEIVYRPEVTFDYLFSAALLSIIEDLYPNIYDGNRVTVAQLSEQLQQGTWQCCLTMKDEYMYKNIKPAFDITSIANTPVDELPVTLADKYTSKAKSMSAISLCIGILALIWAFIDGFPFLFGLVGALTGVISIRTTGKGEKGRKCAIWGIILSMASWILGAVIMLSRLSSFSIF